jgi:creatinine amidohydrolase
MIEWSKLTDPEIAALDRRLPVILPVGLIEAHGPHLESGFDAFSAEYFARELCDATGAILLPAIPYGFADTNWEYTGTLGVKADTLGHVIGDLCSLLCHHGFKRIIVLSGHGGNGVGVTLGFQRAWESYPDMRPAHWTYFLTGGVPMSHADEKETALALAIGGVVHMDRTEDFVLRKPWYEAHSRRTLAPHSGGMNGRPTLATRELGQEIHDRILPVLVEKLKAVIEAERADGS